MSTPIAPPIRILRRNELASRVGLSRTSIYDRLNPASRLFDPTFPRPLKLGKGPNPSVGWLESEVDAWIIAQAARRTPPPATDTATHRA